MTLLLADIGGTNTRCAITRGNLGPGPVTRFRNAGHAGVAELLNTYLMTLPAGERPRQAALAIAAPITGDCVRMTNIDWSFSQVDLAQQLGLDALDILNDFAALAWSLPQLGAGDIEQIGAGTASTGPRVVLGPGTGLGVATLVECGGESQALPGGGGHVTLAAHDEREEAVIRVVRERFGHCSAERLVSGAGLTLLHATLHGAPEIEPAAIGRLADGGDARAGATFEMFFRLLGTVAGDAALTVGATGGVYIAGGIVPRYLEALRRSGFRERFEAKGRYRAYQLAIPTWVITAPQPALTGLAAFVHRRRARA